ncbi:hypothetical protein NPIL_187681 [Nephila pilipes]|uniref:Uncharacterized protein n=1 Tax=Nephila pilipes TaxID=299642 RepID=A0A8X6TH78_NEPPI|nr:hypothetical protein NPIL_187681 [Nephila pilipes]
MEQRISIAAGKRQSRRLTQPIIFKNLRENRSGILHDSAKRDSHLLQPHKNNREKLHIEGKTDIPPKTAKQPSFARIVDKPLMSDHGRSYGRSDHVYGFGQKW